MALKFAILTAGNIATHMAQTVSQMKDEGIECYAIAARSTERAAALAKRCGFSIAAESGVPGLPLVSRVLRCF